MTRTYTPPASEYPRYLGELATIRPLTNAERLATYLYKRAWSGQLRWFRSAGPVRGRNA